MKMKRILCLLLALLMAMSLLSGCTEKVQIEHYAVPMDELPEGHEELVAELGAAPEAAEVPATEEPVTEVTEVPATEEPVTEATEVPATEEPVTEVTEVPATEEPVVEATEVPEEEAGGEAEIKAAALDEPVPVSPEQDDEQEKITVKLDPNGGTFPYEFDRRKGCIEVVLGESGTLTFNEAKEREPKREGYTFKGWFTEETGGEKVEINSQVPEGKTQLYAQWEAITRTVLLHVINGNFGGEWEGKPIDAGGTATIEVTLEGDILPETVRSITPTRTHGEFDGWYTKAPTEEQKSENGYNYWCTVRKNGDKVEPGDEVPAGVTTLYAAFTNTNTVGDNDKLVTYKLNWNGMFGKTAALTCTRKYSETDGGHKLDAEDLLVSGLNWDDYSKTFTGQEDLTDYWENNTFGGYTFKGWATTKTADSPTVKAGDTVVKNGDVLYAVWSKNGATNVTYWGDKPEPTPAVLDGLRIMGKTNKLDTANTGKVHGKEGASFSLELFCTPISAEATNVTWTLEVRKGVNVNAEGEDLAAVFKKPVTLTVKADVTDVTAEGTGITAKAEGLTLTITSNGDTSYGVTVSATATGTTGKAVSSNAPATVNFYHDWNDWTVTKAATAKAEGVETRSCMLCGTQETRPIAKLPATPAPTATAKPAATPKSQTGASGVGGPQMFEETAPQSRSANSSEPTTTAIPSIPDPRYVTIHCPGGSFYGYDTFVVTLTGDGKLPKGFDWYQPTRSGYRFLGWFDKQDGQSDAKEYKMGDSVPEDVNDLYAHWVGVVTLDAEPGNFKDSKEENNNYTRTVELVEGKLPDLSGYTPVYDISTEDQSVEFQGWYTGKSKITKEQKDDYSEWSIKPSGSKVEKGQEVAPGTTLYAGYEGASKTPAKVVTYKLNGNGMFGKTASLICSRTYSEEVNGYKVQAKDLAVSGLNWDSVNDHTQTFKSQDELEDYWKDHPIDGYTFKGWATTATDENPNVKAGETVVKDGDTLYAVWVKGNETNKTYREKPVPTPGPLNGVRIMGKTSKLNTANTGKVHAKPGESFTLELFCTPVGVQVDTVTWTLSVCKGGKEGDSLSYVFTNKPVTVTLEVKSGNTATDESTGIKAEANGLTLTLTCKDDTPYGVTVTAKATGSGRTVSCDAAATVNFYHNWGAEKVTKKATTEAEGTMTRTCTMCSATETRSIAKLPATPAPTATPTAKPTEAPKATETPKPVAPVIPQAAPGVPETPGIEEPTEAPKPAEAPKSTEVPAAKATEAPAAPAAKSAEAPKPTAAPTAKPAEAPKPTAAPTAKPAEASKPTEAPAVKPAEAPKPTEAPAAKPAEAPKPTAAPTAKPAEAPKPTEAPTAKPTEAPKPTATPKPETASAKKLAAPKVTISVASNGIKVSWNKVKGAPRYMVYYRENGGGWKRIGTTTKTSYTRKDAVLKSGVKYEFAVRCCANDKTTMLSGYKASNSLKYYAAPDVTIAKTSAGIKVSWNKVSGVPRYMVYYRENGGSWKKIGTTTATTYTRKAAVLKSGVKYEFTVRCCANDKKTMLGGYEASNALKYTK